MGIRLLVAILIVIGIFLFVYIFGVVIAFKINQIDLLNVGNNHHIYVQYGDALSPKIVGKDERLSKRNNLFLSTSVLTQLSMMI